MVTWLAALALVAAIAAPHFAGLHRVTPRTAASVWMLALLARGLVSVGAAAFFLVYLPRTGLYAAVADWCWNAVLPIVSDGLGLSGHPLTHAAMLLPALALAYSLVWLAFGLARGWLALRRLLGGAFEDGPLGSTVVPDPRVLVAATGLGRPRIVVSARALEVLDERELAASLAHERGHLELWHRPLLLLSMVLGALGRAVPGTRAAQREFAFSLERDADDYAVTATRDPLALAGAICKAATFRSRALAALCGRGRTTLRVEQLLAREASARPPARPHSAVALTAVLGVLVLILVAVLPAWTVAAVDASALLAETGACHPH